MIKTRSIDLSVEYRKTAYSAAVKAVAEEGGSTAAAAEGAQGRYQQYGPWGEWTQEQKDAAEENWTEAQWSDYWAEYDTGLERRVAVRRGLRSVELRPL